MFYSKDFAVAFLQLVTKLTKAYIEALMAKEISRFEHLKI
jgi:hypothetical protein